MFKNSKLQRLLALIMKILLAHFNPIRFFSYFLIAIASILTFGITLSFYSQGFYSFNHQLQTLHKPPTPESPEILNALKSSKHELGIKDVVRNDQIGIGQMLSDEELMWKASLSANTKGRNGGKMGVPKVAFLFLVKGSIPLAPLWEKFFKGHQGFYSIYVHSDPSFNSSSSSSEGIDGGVFRGRRIYNQEVEWGKFSLLEAELRLLANALLDDPSNQRFVLLSESCIPLFNFTTIYSYLINSTQTYIESYDLPGPTGRGRYKRSLGPTVTLRHWRKGSQWFELDRDLSLEVISDQAYFLKFKRACQYSCYADEHYLPTWVNTNEFGARKNSNRSLTWVDWSKGGSHPVGYRRFHVTVESLKRLRRSRETCEYNGKKTNICYLFARKFLPDTLYRLSRFAPKVMHF